MQGICQLLLCEVRYEARGHIAIITTALYLLRGDLPASGNEYRGFTYPSTQQSIYPSPLHPERSRRGSPRALISNSLINSPFGPLPAALCLCRKASAVRHPVDCGLASVLRRGAFAPTSCLLSSTGWALIVKDES